jgi:hypothetical protein
MVPRTCRLILSQPHLYDALGTRFKLLLSSCDGDGLGGCWHNVAHGSSDDGVCPPAARRCQAPGAAAVNRQLLRLSVLFQI